MFGTTSKVILSLVIFAIGSISIQAQDCKTVTDADLVNSLYNSIEQNSSLKPQLGQINITSTYKAIKIRGWVKNSKDYQKVIDLAIDTACVNLVNVNNFEDSEPADEFKSAGGCSGGTKPCGDICIPENEVCSIKGRMGALFMFDSSYYDSFAGSGWSLDTGIVGFGR